ncbi:hypothetical protein ILUMI_13503 [Ignelater luminosus]|uniref:Uncharacterized protein n=1 Tax=Ignelater luminosus TaxID=2038154 RepID=A0A8K0CS99_IGNLU|nr:hypothetical protein ILUMI_13503 [Ignelater luminosus]
MKYYILFFGILATALAQQYTTPVPILKQINRHNEDGSYSYGYEAADGTYKIESKYPNGEVFGKYGFVDDVGKLREIEYGASRRGFEPQGNEINVAPPTLNDKYPAKPLGPNEEDDGQYREDPSIYYKDEKYNQSPAPTYQSAYKSSYDTFGSRYTQPSYQQSYQQPSHQSSYQTSYQSSYQQPAYQQPTYQQPTYQQPAYQQPAYQQPAFRPTTKFSFDDFIQNRPQPEPNFQPSYYNPSPPAYTQNYGRQFAGHPATNVDLNLGSYTVNYKRR